MALPSGGLVGCGCGEGRRPQAFGKTGAPHAVAPFDPCRVGRQMRQIAEREPAGTTARVECHPAQQHRQIEIKCRNRMSVEKRRLFGRQPVERTEMAAHGLLHRPAEPGLGGGIGADILVGIEQHPHPGMHGIGDEKQPFQEIAAFRAFWRGRQCAMGVGQPEQDGGGFKNRSVWSFQHRNQPVRVQFQIVRRPLCPGFAVDQGGLIGLVQFFERQANDQRGIVGGVMQAVAGGHAGHREII